MTLHKSLAKSHDDSSISFSRSLKQEKTPNYSQRPFDADTGYSAL
jgi:hypothetical protein